MVKYTFCTARLFAYITIVGFLLLSCNGTKQNVSTELFEIPVDIDQNDSLSLSEIADEITAVELEMTDESLINTDYISRIIISDNYIIVLDTKVLVFNKEGRFLRRIGSIGQGPGEYRMLMGVAFDEKNERLFITASPNKVICYDINGKFLKESRPVIMSSYYGPNYIDGQLLVVNYQMFTEDEMRSTTTSLLRLTDDFQVIDSLFLWKNHFNKSDISGHMTGSQEFIFSGNGSVYLFCGENHLPGYPPVEIILRDTLYRFEGNQLVPELKFKFKNDGIRGGDKYIYLLNIFRSSRYVFSIYSKIENGVRNLQANRYYFCYDTKTGKSYNMLDGYTDDINGIEKRVRISPLVTDSEIFYYWHTHMKPEDKEEPNPTLYIIKLKK